MSFEKFLTSEFLRTVETWIVRDLVIPCGRLSVNFSGGIARVSQEFEKLGEWVQSLLTAVNSPHENGQVMAELVVSSSGESAFTSQIKFKISFRV